MAVMDSHERAVASVAASIKNFYARKEPFRIYHGSTNSTRQSQYKLDQMVDTSGLNHVLKVDTERKTAIVEPNVPMDALVEATLMHGLVPPVVMEFPGITVGGGFSGTAGESSSFRYGFFDRTINWIEIVLGNGDVVKASSTEKPDLFYGAASSFGTLGVTTLLEIQLIEAKTYVATTYIPVSDMADAQDEIEKATEDPTVNYLDGIMYSPNRGVICVGRLTNSLPDPSVKVQRFTRPTDPWFYIHVECLEHRLSKPITEAIPLVDYLFRYDRGGFWVAKYAFEYFITPFNRITRFLLDYFMHTRIMYHALHQSGFSTQYTIQDVAIPYSRSQEFFNHLANHFQNYPIWLCPLKQSGKSIASTHSLQADRIKIKPKIKDKGKGIAPAKSLQTDKTNGKLEQNGKGIASTHSFQTGKTNVELPEYMLNFGVWGPGSTNREEFVQWNRDFERKVHELGGQKWLYAHTYYTEEEFDEIYNKEAYDKLREKYFATHLPTVYAKVKVDLAAENHLNETWSGYLLALFWSIWPLAGLYGVFKAMIGGDYLLPKTSRRLESLNRGVYWKEA